MLDVFFIGRYQIYTYKLGYDRGDSFPYDFEPNGINYVHTEGI